MTLKFSWQGEKAQYSSLTSSKKSLKTRGHNPNMPKNRPLKNHKMLVLSVKPLIADKYRAAMDSRICTRPANIANRAMIPL